MPVPYTRFVSDASANISFVDLPAGTLQVPYPVPPSESLQILGPVLAPSVFARHLDTIELGSSGSVTFALKDRRAAELAKHNGVNSATLLRSLDAYPLHFLPGDAARTVKVGDLTVSTDASNRCSLVHPGNAISVPGVVEFAKNASATAVTFPGAVAVRANAITWNGAGNTQVLGITAAGNVLSLQGNMSSVSVTSTDIQNRVQVSNMLTYNNLMGGRNYQVIKNGNVSTTNFGGFYFNDNVWVDNTRSLYTNMVLPTWGSKVSVAGDLEVIGNLTFTGATTSITYEDMKIKDKMITLANGVTTLVGSDVSGIEVQTGPGQALGKVAWRVGKNKRALTRAANMDDECYWRVEGGHLRISAGNLDYGLRINARGELEIFKVVYDVSGAPVSTSVVSRHGGNFVDLL